MPRTSTIRRKTTETDIRLRLALDGRGKSLVTTGIRFFDHMLDLVARHAAFDLTIKAHGDLDVDQHNGTVRRGGRKLLLHGRVRAAAAAVARARGAAPQGASSSPGRSGFSATADVGIS